MEEGSRILRGAREAQAIARGEMPGEDYAVAVPASRKLRPQFQIRPLAGQPDQSGDDPRP